MSLIPVRTLLDDDWWFPATFASGYGFPDVAREMHQLDHLAQQMSRIAGEGTKVTDTKDRYQIAIDCRNFKPEEVQVKQTKDFVEVHAKHEERKDNHGFISREFTRRYALPKDVDGQKLDAKMSNGCLRLEAPKLAIEAPKEQTIAIQRE